MSVRTGERGIGKLEFIHEMNTLCIHTIKLCQNDKLFPKKSRWIMANRIVNECLDAASCVKKANSFRLTKDNLEVRRKYQDMAYAHLETMLMLIDLAYNVFEIDSARIEYWSGLVVSTEIKIKSWIKSDRQRMG